MAANPIFISFMLLFPKIKSLIRFLIKAYPPEITYISGFFAFLKDIAFDWHVYC